MNVCVFVMSSALLTLILLTWRIWWAPNKASIWQMGFNLAFKGLMLAVLSVGAGARAVSRVKFQSRSFIRESGYTGMARGTWWLRHKVEGRDKRQCELVTGNVRDFRLPPWCKRDLISYGIFFFLILCWPCISIYLFLNINQLDALNIIISLFQASTCFEHKWSSSGGQNCTIQSLVSSHI